MPGRSSSPPSHRHRHRYRHRHCRSRSSSPPSRHHRRRYRHYRSRSRSRSPLRRRRSRSAERSRPRSRSRSRSRPRSPNRHYMKRKSRGPRMPKKYKIPDNWVDVPKLGTLVGTFRFVALRVPLDSNFSSSFRENSDELWMPSTFLEAQSAADLNVKLLIDLTNTLKYYNGEKEFEDSGVEYVKLKIEGFRGPPATKDVEKFMEIVDGFFAKESEGTIAVHCTHGLNRTGYLIVNYMVERQGLSVTEALAAFALARPPGLIKHMYVKELYKRLGPKEEMQMPVLPQWATDKYGSRKG